MIRILRKFLSSRVPVCDRALSALGWHVVRVTEHAVVSDLHGVVQRIVAAASALPRVGR